MTGQPYHSALNNLKKPEAFFYWIESYPIC